MKGAIGYNMGIYKLSQYNHMAEYKDEWLLYNSLSGALSVMTDGEKAEMDALLLSDGESFSQEERLFLDHLLLNGYIVPTSVNELEILEKKYRERKQQTERLVLTILPTMGCNFGCDYCFEGADKVHRPMDKLVQNALLSWIEKKLDGVRHLSVTWFGGEPTLAMPVIRRLSDRMISLCQQRGIAYTAGIITNGYRLTEEVAGELYVRAVRNIQVTLDGPSDVHDSIRFVKGSHKGSFHQILKNICAYSNAYPAIHTSLRVNVDERNEDSCFRLIEELKELLNTAKNTSIYFAPIHASTLECRHIAEFTLEAIHYAELETRLLRKALESGLTGIGMPPQYMGLCGAANANGYVVLPDGMLHKCWETVSIPEYAVGSILETPAIHEEKFRAWVDWSPFSEAECRDCSLLPNCMGMCTYRFLYKQNYAGNSAASPCPSLKHELMARLMMYMTNRNRVVRK